MLCRKYEWYERGKENIPKAEKRRAPSGGRPGYKLRNGAFKQYGERTFPGTVRAIGYDAKALFIKARVFDQTFRVVKTDRAALEYVTKLTSFYAQYRALGVNYNQVVKELHSHFSEKKTLALLYRLESITRELVVLSEQIVNLSQDFKEKFMIK